MKQEHKDLIQLKEKFKGTSYCSAAFTEIYVGSNGKVVSLVYFARSLLGLA